MCPYIRSYLSASPTYIEAFHSCEKQPHTWNWHMLLMNHSYFDHRHNPYTPITAPRWLKMPLRSGISLLYLWVSHTLNTWLIAPSVSSSSTSILFALGIHHLISEFLLHNHHVILPMQYPEYIENMQYPEYIDCKTYAAFRLACRSPLCCFDDDICTTALSA